MIISPDSDYIVPSAVAYASCKRQVQSGAVTEIVQMTGPGHALTIDHGWREVAESRFACCAGAL